MPVIAYDTEVGQMSSEEAASLALRIEEHKMKLEVMRLCDDMKARQHERDEQATETEIRKVTVEIERLRLQSEEGGQVRAHEEKRQEQEHIKEMMRLQMEENRCAREHELTMKREAQEALKLELEVAKAAQTLEKQKTVNLKFQFSDNRHARKHEISMKALEVEKLKSEEEIMGQRRDEKGIVMDENEEQLNELRNQREQLERQIREQDDIRDLRNLGLLAAGVGTASGAISGALGTTAAVGLAAGVAGAATVLAPVTAAVAIMSGAGYVYKKSKSSNRA